jgi:poly(glycerol-phosphate) alpha-glucosyltransferase
MFVLPNGTSPAVLAQPGAERTGVLYLGRLHPKKQVMELAAAWARSPLLAPYTLTIAGWGAPAYEAAIKAVAGAATNVRFVGGLYGADKVRAFETARAFILPSLSEGLPMSVLEALQHGCLPLITDHCNLPELFTDGAALRIASNLSDLERVVVTAVAQPDEVLRERSAFLMLYAHRYRWSEIAHAMIERYRQILDRPGQAHRP